MENKNKFRKSNRVLLDERPLVLQPSLATAVGTDAAIVIQQLHFHLANPDNGRIHDGEQWIFKTYEDWRKHDFPFWSERTIRRILSTLEKGGMIVSCQPEGRDNRRKYYRIDYARLKKACTRTRTRAGSGQKWRIDAAKNGASSYAETTRTETTLKSTHHSAALHDVGGFEGDEFLTEEQRAIVAHFNRTLVPLGFTPVRKVSPEVEKALDTFGDSVGELVDSVAAGDSDVRVPKRKTLVRLCWDNLQ